MYYFAYGSNLGKKQMMELCPGSKPMFVATLPNYKLVFVDWSRHWRGGIVTIKPFRGEKVLGAIYQVSEQCLKHLDRLEGGSRFKITVFDDDGQPIEAITHIGAGQGEETRPSPEYLAIIQLGYKDWRII